ncbi:carboxymuconolactone decarboxylase family protein [Dyella sp.]|uniref:carboxymuconolactone decarboxylase family protein n=1 Tax=Dyella sp. TaxID=1869338 RepID=UPI002ED0B77D
MGAQGLVTTRARPDYRDKPRVALSHQRIAHHLRRAFNNDLTREELIGIITHLTFYSGWPTAASAISIARTVFDEAGV